MLEQAQESYDQPEEERNEAGDPIEPFHLRKEMEVGGKKQGELAVFSAARDDVGNECWLVGLIPPWLRSPSQTPCCYAPLHVGGLL